MAIERSKRPVLLTQLPAALPAAILILILLASAAPHTARAESDSVQSTLLITNIMDFLDRVGDLELKAKIFEWWRQDKIKFGDLGYGANAEYDRETGIITISEDVLGRLRGDNARDFWVIADVAQTLAHEFVHAGQNRLYWNSSELSNRGGLFGHFAESEAYYSALDKVEAWISKSLNSFSEQMDYPICDRVTAASELAVLSKLWVDYNNSIKALSLANRDTPLAHYTRVSGMLDLARDDLAEQRRAMNLYTRQFRDGDPDAQDRMDATEDAIAALEAKVKDLEVELEKRRADLDENPWFQLRDTAELQSFMEDTLTQANAVLSEARDAGCFSSLAPPGLTLDQALVRDARNTQLLYGAPILGEITMSVSGGFQAVYDAACNPPVVTGPQDVAGPVRLRAHILGTPPVPAQWSLGNWNSGLAVVFERRLGSGYGSGEELIRLAGQVADNDLSGEFDVPGPGRLTMTIYPAQGSGPLTGSCFEQTFSAILEKVNDLENGPGVMGDTLHLGDGVRTGPGGRAILDVPGSSSIFIDQNTFGTLEQDGTATIFHLDGGSIHIRTHENGTSLGILTPTHFIEPLGTEYSCTVSEQQLNVRVHEGSVRITSQGGQGDDVTLAAGQEVTLPGGEVTAFDMVANPGPIIDGIPFRDMRFDDAVAEPYGEHQLILEAGAPAGGWFLEDPGADAVLAAEGDGFSLTVPDGNELWQTQATAPRMLHKATGDFDLETEVYLESPGNHMATAEFVLYAPGSATGILAGQAQAGAINAHYRIMGGWSRFENLNKLPLWGRIHRESADAPEDYVHLRLTRRGDVFQVFWSLDGERWALGSRQILVLPETLWAGMLFKRVAADGQGPSMAHVRRLALATAQRGTLTSPAWDEVATPGAVEAADAPDSWTLHVPAGVPQTFRILGSQPLAGDFDLVARFDLDPQAELPSGAHWGLAAESLDQRDSVYANRCFNEGFGNRYAVDLRLGTSWRGYDWIDTVDRGGWLRLTRINGRVRASHWSAGHWVEVRAWDLPLETPLYPMLFAGNEWETRAAPALDVTMTMERLAQGPEAAEPWTPEGVTLLSPMDAPPAAILPPGTEGVFLQAPFDLCKLGFGPDGALYALSSARDLGILARITDFGAASALHVESDALKGLNGKGFTFDGQDLIVAVDYWPESGSSLSGLYRVAPDGSFTQMNLAEGHGGLIDVLPAPGGGWYMADFENDGVFRLAAEGQAELAVSRDPLLPGAFRLAVDPQRNELYVLNRTGDWPFAGAPALYLLNAQGQAREYLANPAGTNYGGVALNSGSGLPQGIYLSDTESGQVLLLKPGSGPMAFISGLDRPGDLVVSQDGRGLGVIFDQNKLLWLRPR